MIYSYCSGWVVDTINVEPNCYIGLYTLVYRNEWVYEGKRIKKCN